MKTLEKRRKAVEAQLRYKEQNRDKVWAAQRKHARAVRAKALEVLGGVCVRCGFSEPCALQIDHIDGGGAQERRALGGASRSIYKRVIAGEPGYQLLCANCNWLKRCERGEHYRKAA